MNINRCRPLLAACALGLAASWGSIASAADHDRLSLSSARLVVKVHDRSSSHAHRGHRTGRDNGRNGHRRTDARPLHRGDPWVDGPFYGREPTGDRSWRRDGRCHPRRALRRAWRMGVDGAHIHRVRSHVIVVSGYDGSDHVRVRFARDRRCTVLAVRY